MGTEIPVFPFQATEEELSKNLDRYVKQIICSLQSEFMELPKGTTFISYEDFSRAYEHLKKQPKTLVP